jgi:hypothetical protein
MESTPEVRRQCGELPGKTRCVRFSACSRCLRKRDFPARMNAKLLAEMAEVAQSN